MIMNRRLVFCLVLVGISLFRAAPVLAGSVFVSQMASGNVVRIDEAGTQTIFASGLGQPGPLKFDKAGNLFVLDFSVPQVLKITPTGAVSTFTTGIPGDNFVALTIADDGTVFLLVNGQEPTVGEATAEVWELVEGGAAILLATTVNDAPLGQSARGFTFGPGGDLYLAMQGGNGGGRIMRVTRAGQVSTFFDPGLPAFNSGGGDMVDVRFDSQGDMLILGHVPPGNSRIIWKVQNGVFSTFVGAGAISSGALQLSIDSSDNLFVSGGGFGGGDPDGAIQRIDPSGTVTTLTTFPGAGPIIDIDDGSFDSFPLTSTQVVVDINSGNPANSINPGSKALIPVVILTTAGFDAATVDPASVRFGPDGAVATIDPLSVTFAPNRAAATLDPSSAKSGPNRRVKSHGRGHLKDVDRDGDLDLVLHFRTQDTGITCGDTSVALTGQTFSGQAINGSVSISTVGCKPGKKRPKRAS